MKRAMQKKLLFRLGFGLIFLSSAVQAFVAPGEFRELVAKLPMLPQLIDPALFVKLIGVNDLVLFVLILSGKWPRLVGLWAGLWIVGVIIAQGIWTSETIFHLGIVALAVYHAAPSQSRKAT